MRWPKTKRNHCFEVLFSLILCNNNEPFLDWIVMCDEKWILYDNQHRPAQWLDREEVPKHFLKPNLHQKRSWSLFGGLLPIWPVIAFWILASPYVWEVCSAHQWDAPKTAVPTVGIGQQKGPSSSPQQRPTSHHTANTSEVEWIGLWSFASSAIFPWPLTNWLQLLQASQQLFIERLLP